MNIQPDPEADLGDIIDWTIPVDRVLYEAEQPIVFVTHSLSGQMMLAYLAFEDAHQSYVVLAPTSESSIRQLEQGASGVREALTSSWTWLARKSFADRSLKVWAIDHQTIPDGYLPLEATPLLPEHVVVFSAKAIGEGLVPGKLPCSVISTVANATKAALKSMLDHVLETNTTGRPSDGQRLLYDLPVQHLKLGSFVIGLSEPDVDEGQAAIIANAIGQLKDGLAWAEDGSAGSDLDDVSPGWNAVLRATLALTPPSTGTITAMEIGGSWFGGDRFHLTRESRQKVMRQLRSVRDEKVVMYSGRIGEIDDDNLSFTLRETEGAVDRRGSFDEELHETMRTHFYDSVRITLSGVEIGGRLRVTAVARSD